MFERDTKFPNKKTQHYQWTKLWSTPAVQTCTVDAFFSRFFLTFFSNVTFLISNILEKSKKKSRKKRVHCACLNVTESLRKDRRTWILNLRPLLEERQYDFWPKREARGLYGQFLRVFLSFCPERLWETTRYSFESLRCADYESVLESGAALPHIAQIKFSDFRVVP